MEEVKIRSAKIEDAPDIARINIQTWQNSFKGQLSASYLKNLSLEQKTQKSKDGLQNPQRKFYIAEISGKVVGYCSVSFNTNNKIEPTGEFKSVYVDSDYTGQGIGAMLMKKGLSSLKERGISKAFLWELSSNTKTRKWYETQGWKLTKKVRTRKDNDIELVDVCYVINL